MKRIIIALLTITFGMAAYGQFFSKEEKAKDQQKPEIRATIPEAEQKEIFIKVIDAKAVSRAKANQLYPVKIQQTPEEREARKEKAQKTQTTLMKRYKAEITKEYNISEDYLNIIMKTGWEEGWPKTKKAPAEE